MKKLVIFSVLLLAGTVVLAGCQPKAQQAADQFVDDDVAMEEKDGDAMMEEKDGDAMMEEKDGDAMMEEKDGDAMMEEKDGDAMMEDGDSVTMHTFDLTGKNFEFSQDEIRVKVGDRVKIVFTSTGGFHDWVVDEFNARTSQISEGNTSEVEFVASKKGTFEYYCSVGNHRQLGMVGSLIVE